MHSKVKVFNDAQIELLIIYCLLLPKKFKKKTNLPEREADTSHPCSAEVIHVHIASRGLPHNCIRHYV
jgi:hypothetical protein